MQKRYIDKLGLHISPLGAGIMRFQSENGALSEEAFKLVEIAMSEGLNYYDTAYFYNGGHSEEFIRKSLVEKYARDRFIIADKLPVWVCNCRDDMERIFNEQLERLGVDYIDVYLLHSLHKRTWLQVYNNGVLDFLEQKLKEGLVHNAGFSFHDNVDKLPMIADSFDWNMAQLQLNYYDWSVHDVGQSYEYLINKGIPIVAMEPLGGGRLIKLPERAEQVFRSSNESASIASWGLRYCATLPGVAVVLSGMREESELRENLSAFNPIVPLTDNEYGVVKKVSEIIISSGTIPCSACRYCTEGCPVEIDIPHIFQQYNDYKLFERPASLSWAYMDMVPAERRADKCINCGQCSSICPQKIEIPAELERVHSIALMLTLFHDAADFNTTLFASADKRLALFGAGNFGVSALKYLHRIGITPSFFCDNGKHLWGTTIEGIPVISPAELCAENAKAGLNVLITNQYHFSAIKQQLTDLGICTLN